MPSTATLINEFSLADAQKIAKALVEPMEVEQRQGRGIVIDLLGSPVAQMVSNRMAQAGLAMRTLSEHSQATPYQCGHNSAGWCVMLRALGNNFQDLTIEQAREINVEEFNRAQNVRLGKPAGSTEWLSGDEVVRLINLDNPDGVREPMWLSGPAPLNLFYTLFADSMVRPDMRGRIFIMVVNTAIDHGVVPPLGSYGGVHWFVVAWRVDP